MIAIAEITRHAAARWRERTGERIPLNLRKLWDEQIETAEEIELDSVGLTIALLNHRFKDARYFRSKGGWVFVLQSGKIVTVHHGTAKQFKNAKKKAP